MRAETGTRGHRGQSLVELALLLPLLLWLIAGAMDFARVYYYDIVVINAARAGARVAADISKQDSDVIAAVQNDALPMAIPAGSISISPSGTRTTGQDVAVTVTYTFAPVTPLLGSVLPGGQLSVSRSATMVAF